MESVIFSKNGRINIWRLCPIKYFINWIIYLIKVYLKLIEDSAFYDYLLPKDWLLNIVFYEVFF
jgi:hypothetical protein